MTPLLKKMNFKQQQEICILQHPAEFEPQLNAIREYTDVRTRLEDIPDISFVVAFVKSQADVDRIAPIASQKLKGDGILWFAYPNKSSKKYHVDIHKDSDWQILDEQGFKTVRSVAIDEDWSALRFRWTEYVNR